MRSSCCAAALLITQVLLGCGGGDTFENSVTYAGRPGSGAITERPFLMDVDVHIGGDVGGLDDLRPEEWTLLEWPEMNRVETEVEIAEKPDAPGYAVTIRGTNLEQRWYAISLGRDVGGLTYVPDGQPLADGSWIWRVLNGMQAQPEQLVIDSSDATMLEVRFTLPVYAPAMAPVDGYLSIAVPSGSCVAMPAASGARIVELRCDEPVNAETPLHLVLSEGLVSETGFPVAPLDIEIRMDRSVFGFARTGPAPIPREMCDPAREELYPEWDCI